MRLQLLSNRRHVTGLNLDVEQDSHTNLTQVAFDNFTAALATFGCDVYANQSLEHWPFKRHS